jgi:hypothetical protein
MHVRCRPAADRMAVGFILRDAVSDTGRLLQEKQAEVMNREPDFL